MRAIVFNFVGKDGKRCSVTFDRYGMNSHVFQPGKTDEQIVALAGSAALGAIIDQKGPEWTDTYNVTIVD